jgi:type VI secretion system protein ImpA
MPLRDDLLNPIPGDNPSGENLRYAPVYDKIKEARRQDDDVPQGEWQHERKMADWPAVIKLTQEALATKSKDLQLAAWLTEAMLRREGFAGFRASVELIRNLIDTFWDTLYPEIEDDDVELRAMPVEWIGTKFDDLVRQTGIVKSGLSFVKYKESRAVGYEADCTDDAKLEARQTAIAEGKMTAEEFDKALEATPVPFLEALLGDMDGTLENLDGLGEVCEARFGDYAPTFGRLKETIQEVRAVAKIFHRKKAAPVEETPAASESAAEETSDDGWSWSTPAEEPAPAAQPAAAAPRPARKVTSAEPADAEDAGLRLAAVAKWARAQDGYNPAPYLMLRGWRWGELRASGEEPDAGLLEAPPTETRRALRQMAADYNWTELIETAEDAMSQPCGRAWLDLQRYVVKALGEQGYDKVAAAIRSELRALLTDLPKLKDMVLLDDTPAANPETQAWLKEEVLAGAATVAAASYAAPPQADWGNEPDEEKEDAEALGGEKIPDAYELAQICIDDGRFADGLALVMKAAAHEASGRGRFQRQMQVAQLCMAHGHEAVALPILEKLAALMDRHELEGWEASDVLGHPLALLYRCQVKLDKPAEERQRVYERLCRISPVQALAVAR